MALLIDVFIFIICNPYILPLPISIDVFIFVVELNWSHTTPEGSAQSQTLMFFLLLVIISQSRYIQSFLYFSTYLFLSPPLLHHLANLVPVVWEREAICFLVPVLVMLCC